GKRGVLLARDDDELGALALDEARDQQQLVALARIRDRDDDVLGADHAQVAVTRLGGVHEVGGGAGARERGRDLARDVAGFADPGHDDAPALFAAEDQRYRGKETLIEAADERAHRVRFDLQHFARHVQRRPGGVLRYHRGKY